MTSQPPPSSLPPAQAAYRRRVLIASGITIAILIAGCCGSCGLLALGTVNDAVAQIKGNATILQEIGDVRKVEPDMEAQKELPQEEQQKGTVLVFKATGTDGNAQIVVELGPLGAKLKRMTTEDGRVIRLDEGRTSEEPSEQEATDSSTE